MRDSTRSFTERVQFVTQEFASDPRVDTVGICDLQGNRYDIAGNTTAAGNYEWFRSAATGNNFVSEPQVSRSSNKMQMIFAVPIYGEGHTPIGVLSVSVPAQLLNDIVKDITVGHTGYCYSIGGTGTTIAHKNTDRVLKALNMIEAAKQDDSLRSLASFVTNALHTADSSVGYYSYKGDSVIGAFSKIKTAGWTVIVRSPVKEFRASLKTRLDF